MTRLEDNLDCLVVDRRRGAAGRKENVFRFGRLGLVTHAVTYDIRHPAISARAGVESLIISPEVVDSVYYSATRKW